MKKKLICVLLVICMLALIYPVGLNTSARRISSVTTLAHTPLNVEKLPSSVSAYNGKTAKVTVKATGDGLKYTWYYKDAGSSSFTVTETFKGDTYQVAMNSRRDQRQIYCKITDKYGNSVETNKVTLKLRTDLKITLQPVSVSAYNGKTAKVTVKATGDGLQYTWYYKDAGSSSFTVTDTFKSNTYQVTMNSKRNQRQIYCKITDKYGSSVETNKVTLEMSPPLGITLQPVSVSAQNGKTAKVTVKASGVDLKYTWYYKNAGSPSFKITDTFKGDTYQVTMNSKRDQRQIYCKITDKYGDSVVTDTVKLYMKASSPEFTCSACLEKNTGTWFYPTMLYTQESSLKSMPLTFESVFSISKDDISGNKMFTLDRDAAYTETVLFSNDDTYEPGICFSVTENGNPKVGLRPDDSYRRSKNFLFDKVNVFSDKPVHMAITIDLKKDNVKCYINGKLMQTITGVSKAVTAPFVSTNKYAVGGDLYSGNPNHFLGKIYDLSVWSDVRSEAEIKTDYFVGLDINDAELMASYDLSLCTKCMKKDRSSNSNDLVSEKLWQDISDLAPVKDYDYSFAVIGDTQELSEDAPVTLSMLYDWLINNKESHKIEYVLGLGDITQKSYDYEWEYAKEQIYKLNGNIPYLLSRGNHDYDTVVDSITTAGFNKTFDDGIYNKQLTGTMIEGDVTNAYRTITIGNIDYLFLSLDFGPNAEMLAWADSVVSAHPNHRVVVITHGYLYRDGTTLDKNDAYSASTSPIKDRKPEQAEKPSLDGDEIWKQFASKHPNIQLVLSGHDPCQHVVYRQDKGDMGNTVTQMLIDPQGIDAFYSPTGMVAMFYFSDNGNRLTVRYYSVVNGMYGSERSQFTIDLS